MKPKKQLMRETAWLVQKLDLQFPSFSLFEFKKHQL
jgi:hypothetical protein